MKRPPRVHLERMRNGGYRAAYMVDGRRERHTLQTSDESEAKMLAAQLQSRLLAAFYSVRPKPSREPLSLADLAKKYKTLHLVEPEVSAAHAKRQGARLDAVLESLGSTKRADALDGVTVETWKVKRLEEGKSPTTVHNDLVALRAMLAWAEKMELIPRLPFFAPPKARSHRSEVIPLEHVRKILKGLDLSQPTHRAFFLAINTGMRTGDLEAVRWEHIDFDEGVLRLTTSKKAVPLVFPLPWSVLALLKPHRALGPICKTLDTTGAKRLTKPLCDGTGYGLRICRPTFGTALHKAGADYLLVKLLLAHKVSDVTAGYIVGGDIERLRDAASRLPWIDGSQYPITIKRRNRQSRNGMG